MRCIRVGLLALGIAGLLGCGGSGTNKIIDGGLDGGSDPVIDANRCVADPLGAGCPCDPGTDPVPGCSSQDCIDCVNDCMGAVYYCSPCYPDCDGGSIDISHCDPFGCTDAG